MQIIFHVIDVIHNQINYNIKRLFYVDVNIMPFIYPTWHSLDDVASSQKHIWSGPYE